MMSNGAVENMLLKDMHRNLGWLFGLGAVLVALGIAGFYFKLTFAEIAMRYLGGLLIVVAGIQCIDVYKTERWLIKFWRSLAVVLYFAGGLMMLIFPDQSSSLVIMLFGAVLIVVGSFRIIIALQARHQMKLWIGVVVFGVIAIVLGCMLLAGWPWPAIEVLGIFISLDLILQGASMLYMGFVAMSAGRQGKHPETAPEPS